MSRFRKYSGRLSFSATKVAPFLQAKQQPDFSPNASFAAVLD